MRACSWEFDVAWGMGSNHEGCEVKVQEGVGFRVAGLGFRVEG